MTNNSKCPKQKKIFDIALPTSTNQNFHDRVCIFYLASRKRVCNISFSRMVFSVLFATVERRRVHFGLFGYKFGGLCVYVCPFLSNFFSRYKSLNCYEEFIDLFFRYNWKCLRLIIWIFFI